MFQSLIYSKNMFKNKYFSNNNFKCINILINVELKIILCILSFYCSCTSDGQDEFSIVVRDPELQTQSSNSDNTTNPTDHTTTDSPENSNNQTSDSSNSSENQLTQVSNDDSIERLINTDESIYEIVFINDVGYAVTKNKIFKTNDGGLSWSSIFVSLNDDTFSSLYFENQTTGYINLGGNLYETKNGGITFNSIWDFNTNRSNYVDHWINDIVKLDNDLFVLVGQGSTGGFVGNTNYDKSDLIENYNFYNHNNFTLWKINLNESTIEEIINDDYPSYGFYLFNGKIYIPTFKKNVGTQIFEYDIELNTYKKDFQISNFFPLNLNFKDENFYGFGITIDGYSTSYYSNGNPINGFFCDEELPSSGQLTSCGYIISSNLDSSPTYKLINDNQFDGVVFNDSVVMNDIIFISGKCGTLIKSSNQGSTWEKIELNSDQDIYGIEKVDQNRLIVFGENGFSLIIQV